MSSVTGNEITTDQISFNAFERVLMVRHFSGGAVLVLRYYRRIMGSCIYAIYRQAPKAVGNWALAGAFGKKATEEEEYRPPFEVESAKK